MTATPPTSTSEDAIDLAQIGETIREHRFGAAMSQQDAATAGGCSQVAISSYERGERVMPIDVAIRLARYHGITVDVLLFEQPPGQPISGEDV